jgi:hypothetical protein
MTLKMKGAPNKSFQRILKMRHFVDRAFKTAELERYATKEKKACISK